MLEHLSERAGGDPEIGVLAALIRLDLGTDDSSHMKLGAAIQRFPPNRWMSKLSQARVAQWIAAEVQPYPAGRDSAGRATAHLDPDAHADSLIRAVEAKCKALGVYPALFPAVVLDVAAMAAYRGKALRDSGRLDDAREIVQCFSAFAREVALRDPDEPAFHMAMSIAFAQESKNAWKVEDFATIELALMNALREARTALRLDPRNADTRLRVAGLQEKLFGLASRRSASP
jgi:hypothetical protein